MYTFGILHICRYLRVLKLRYTTVYFWHIGPVHSHICRYLRVLKLRYTNVYLWHIGLVHSHIYIYRYLWVLKLRYSDIYYWHIGRVHSHHTYINFARSPGASESPSVLWCCIMEARTAVVGEAKPKVWNILARVALIMEYTRLMEYIS